MNHLSIEHSYLSLVFLHLYFQAYPKVFPMSHSPVSICHLSLDIALHVFFLGTTKPCSCVYITFSFFLQPHP